MGEISSNHRYFLVFSRFPAANVGLDGLWRRIAGAWAAGVIPEVRQWNALEGRPAKAPGPPAAAPRGGSCRIGVDFLDPDDSTISKTRHIIA
jgi:hypothetical protein